VLQLFLRWIWLIFLQVISKSVIITTEKTVVSGTQARQKQLCFLVPLDQINHATIEDMPDVYVVENLLWLLTPLVVKPLG
jgi:hypothetical protein